MRLRLRTLQAPLLGGDRSGDEFTVASMIKDNGDALVDLLAKATCTLRAQRLFVPVQADDAIRARTSVQNAVHQAKPGPEEWERWSPSAGNGFHFSTGPAPASMVSGFFGLELLGGLYMSNRAISNKAYGIRWWRWILSKIPSLCRTRG